MGGEPAFQAVAPPLHDLVRRIHTVSEVHEDYLKQKQWPEI
jgi:hypothetical protein